MSDLVDKLLEPVSPDQPCGPDLSNDPQFDELETILKGKPEIDFGNIKKPAEPPDWRQLQEKSIEFLGHSKHLRAGTMLCCSLIKTGGLAGFRDGMQLLRGLVERYWGAVHPLLDPEDGNDPTYRLNILGALTAPRGSVTGWLAIIDHLYAAPIYQPRGGPPIAYEHLLAAKLRQAGGEGAPQDGPSLSGLAPFLRAGADQIAIQHQALKEALEASEGMDQFLGNTLSAQKSMSFEELHKTLREMLSSLEPYLPGTQSPAGAEPGAAQAGSEAPATGTVAQPISGVIRSREDVISALESICRYYDQVEPGSPVPFLLRRTRKLVMMNFVEAVQELNLISGLDALRPSMGSAVESVQPPSGS